MMSGERGDGSIVGKRRKAVGNQRAVWRAGWGQGGIRTRLSSSSGPRSGTGGPSGAREREPVADQVFPQRAAGGFRLTAPLGPPVCAAKTRLAGG